MRQVLSSENEKLLKRTDVFGTLELRRAICRHLKAFRNMDISESQVIIGAGTESLYSMLVQFLGRDEVFAVENPGYHKAAEIFRLNGVKCEPVNIDEHGIIIEELQKAAANIVHVSPSHHFPSGVIMNFKRRTELLEWAKKAPDRFIIEDDYDSEFRFIGKPLPTLQSIDQNGRVIYINTFSKTLSPSFRISYMILPQELAAEFSKKLGFYSCQVSSFEQFTLARFIEAGHYEKHINRMKNYYRSLRNILITGIENSALSKAFSIREENSGLHFLLTLNNGFDARLIQEKWRKEGINIQLLSDYYYDKKTLPSTESFVINYSGIKKDSVNTIIQKMSQAHN
jgi:GntR family transcriptional regulator/MocR family aminotransferase